jgi:hypothetical protein
MSRLFPLAAAALAALAFTTTAPAGVSCHNINAKGVGQDLGGGNTVADINGGGLLNGTTVGSFAPVGFTLPSTALVVGTVTFTVNKGTLTVSLAGSLDVVSGAFSTTGPVTGSTGKLAGASGALSFNGVEDFTTGAFTETVTGNICADLSP